MVFWPVWNAKFSKIRAAFFSINSLFGLKANGPFSAKSWPGPLWKLKFAIWSLERAILKPKLATLKLKVTVLKQKWSFGRFGMPNFPKFKPHFFDKFLIRLKGKRAVSRQILPGAPLEAQICHLEPRTGHFEAKIGHFEAKSDRFEAKTVFWTVLKAKFSKMQAVFVSMNSFFGLKANGPFCAKSWPGPLWKLKFAIWSLEWAILKPKLAILKLKPIILKLKPASLKLKPTIFKLKPIILKLKPTLSKLKPIILKLHLGACLKHTSEVGILGLALNPKKWTIGRLTSKAGEGRENKNGLPRTQRPNNNIHQKPLRS